MLRRTSVLIQTGKPNLFLSSTLEGFTHRSKHYAKNILASFFISLLLLIYQNQQKAFHIPTQSNTFFPRCASKQTQPTSVITRLQLPRNDANSLNDIQNSQQNTVQTASIQFLRRVISVVLIARMPQEPSLKICVMSGEMIIVNGGRSG